LVYPSREPATHMPDGKQKGLAEKFSFGLEALSKLPQAL
jgi:hypothetical protein